MSEIVITDDTDAFTFGLSWEIESNNYWPHTYTHPAYACYTCNWFFLILTPLPPCLPLSLRRPYQQTKNKPRTCPTVTHRNQILTISDRCLDSGKCPISCMPPPSLSPVDQLMNMIISRPANNTGKCSMTHNGPLYGFNRNLFTWLYRPSYSRPVDASTQSERSISNDLIFRQSRLLSSTPEFD